MSFWMKAANASGEFPTVCMACFSSSSLVAGSAKAFTISAFSFWMTAGGVLAGARMPCQASASKPG